MADIFTDYPYNPFEMTDFESYLFKGKGNKSGGKNKKLLDIPLIIYDEEFEKGLESRKFRRLVQEISDYMLFSGSDVYDGNQNSPNLYAAVKGVIDPREYMNAEYTFGDKGIAPIRDNHFYYNALETIISESIRQPFKFSITTISNEYSNQVVKENAKAASSYIMDLALQALSENGVPQMGDFAGGNVDKNITPKELISKLDTQKYLEKIVYDLISDVKNRGYYTRLVKEAMYHKFVLNSEFAFVNENGEPSCIDPWKVRWISGNESITNLSDDSVIAVSYTDHMSLTEIMNKFGHLLDTGTGASGLKSVVKSLKKGVIGGYNPFEENIGKTTEVWHTNFSGYTSSLKEREEVYAPSYVKWMKEIFYPSRKMAYGLSYSFLVQRLYFKVIKNEKYSVKINGKTATRATYDKWLKSSHSTNMIAEFEELKEGESRSGKFVIDKPKVLTYQAIRIGHNTLIDVGPYRFESNNSSSPRWPIIGEIARDKSLANIGYNYAVWTNVIFNRIEEIIDNIGLSRALLLDENQMVGHGDEKDFLYNAKKSGIGIFNSSRINSSNIAAASRHLSLVDLGNNAEEVSNLLATIGLFKTLYENSIGTSPQLQGIGDRYQGKAVTQMNIQNQGILKVKKMHEHNSFMNQVLQCSGDILKRVNAKDNIKNVIVDNNEKAFLKLTKDLDLYDFNMYLESGFDLQEKKNAINNLALQIGASGGVEIIDNLIDLIITDNPQEAREIFRKTKDFLSERQMQIQQAQIDSQNMKTQADSQKAQIPVVVQQMRSETDIELQKMKQEDLARRDNNRYVKQDMEEEDLRERMLFESLLRQGETEENARIQQSINPKKE